MSQYNRMINELAYRSDDQTRTLMQENKKLLYEYNHLSPEKWDQETILLKKILGKCHPFPPSEPGHEGPGSDEEGY